MASLVPGVTPLGAQRDHLPRARQPLERPGEARATAGAEPVEEVAARERLRALVGEGFRFEVIDDGDRIEGRRLDVDRRELVRLRRGAYTVDGTLDLHGLRVAEARLEVGRFVRERAAAGDRVLRLVHGKGEHSPGGVPVLRGEIAAWLGEPRVAPSVSAFASALPDEGGRGALYVLLARR